MMDLLKHSHESSGDLLDYEFKKKPKDVDMKNDDRFRQNNLLIPYLIFIFRNQNKWKN